MMDSQRRPRAFRYRWRKLISKESDLFSFTLIFNPLSFFPSQHDCTYLLNQTFPCSVMKNKYLYRILSTKTSFLSTVQLLKLNSHSKIFFSSQHDRTYLLNQIFLCSVMKNKYLYRILSNKTSFLFTVQLLRLNSYSKKHELSKPFFLSQRLHQCYLGNLWTSEHICPRCHRIG